MSKLYTQTLKYFHLAIKEFIPNLEKLRSVADNQKQREDLEDLLEAYVDIAAKIDSYNLNYDDPNKFYDGEPDEIEIEISNVMIENLCQLTYRLLLVWKKKLERLQKKQYLTLENKKSIHILERLINPLESLSNADDFVLGKYFSKGPLKFPGEEYNDKKISLPKIQKSRVAIFPKSLINKVPKDVATLCEEFNFNFQHGKANASIFLLRRILPLAIVRKFQKMGKEDSIKDISGELLDTKALLGKIESVLSNNRIYKEIMGYKILVDSSQHSFSINMDIVDAEGAAVKIRILLDDIF